MSQPYKNLEKIMKTFQKAEPFVLGILLVSVLLKIWHQPVSILIIISSATLAQFNIFKAQLPREDLNPPERFISKIFYFLLGIGYVAVLFRIQHWPGLRPMSTVFLGGATFTALVLFTMIKRPINQVFKRSDLIQFGCVLIYLLLLYFVK